MSHWAYNCNGMQLTFVLISSKLMTCSAFLTVFQSFLSLIEDTMAHSPYKKQYTHRKTNHYFLLFIFFTWNRSTKLYVLALDSCNAGSLSPTPAGAASRLFLPPLADRRCGSFSPRDSDARPSTSPAGSSGCDLRPHPPMGIMILKTAALQLAEKTWSYGPVTRFKTHRISFLDATVSVLRKRFGFI